MLKLLKWNEKAIERWSKLDAVAAPPAVLSLSLLLSTRPGATKSCSESSRGRSVKGEVQEATASMNVCIEERKRM